MTCVSSFDLTGLLSCTQSRQRDVAQGVGRYVAGQDDDRDLAVKLFRSVAVSWSPSMPFGRL